MAVMNETKQWLPVNLSGYHGGQIVTPIVEFRFALSRQNRLLYDVRYRMHDTSEKKPDDQLGPWTEYNGEYWDCIHWLESQGVYTEQTRGF